ncbi:MAG: hypothetical protein EOO48_05000 [Flavobacterium sp.]|nr:MAG: hypothetical protein EOO48_05000 [Flavobacterium sp.]
MDASEKNPGNTKWNNEQEVNEGFSSQNLPDGYDPSEKIADQMHSEIEIDQDGNETEVKRARFTNQNDSVEATPDNRIIENKKLNENRDKNYDAAANRYPHSNPESHRDRGNFDVNES